MKIDKERKKKTVAVSLFLIILGFILLVWKTQTTDDVVFEMNVSGIEDSCASMVLYWDLGSGIDGENYLAAEIVNNQASLTIPKEVVKNSKSYRFDPINIKSDCVIQGLYANGEKIGKADFTDAIFSEAQVEVLEENPGEYDLRVVGNDPQIYLDEQFAGCLKKSAQPSWIEVLLIWGMGVIFALCFWLIGADTCFVGLMICCALSYIVGGVDAVYGYVNAERKNWIFVSYFLIIASLSISFVGMKYWRWDERLGSFSWKNYCEGFKERYHCNAIDGLALSLIAILGGVLRIVGYNWGIVATFQADECKLVEPAMEMARKHTIYQRTSFYYPDQFTSKFASLLIAIYSRFTGTAIDEKTMVEAYFMFRIVVVVCSILTIFTAFLIGNYLEKHLGVVFAGLFSVFPIFINLSKQVTGDTTALFFLSLTILFALRYMEEKKNIFLVMMSMGAAMATLEKWHGAVGIGFIGIVVLLNSRKVKEFFYKGIYALAAYFAWLLLLAPNMMFHLKSAIVDGFINIAVYDNSEGNPFNVMLKNYGMYGIEHVAGFIYIVALGIGCIYIFSHFCKQYTIFLLAIIKIFILCFLNRQFVRWGLELYFVELLIASIGIMWLINRRNAIYRVIGSLICCVTVIDLLSGSLLDVAVATHTQNDTRMVQRVACEQMGATSENTVSAAFTGFVPGGWCDKVYGDEGTLYVFWGEYFEERDGVIYRTKDNMDYVVMNTEVEGTSWANRLKSVCNSYWEYDPICVDNLDEPIQSTERTLNDVILIRQNLYLAKQIFEGAMSGRSIIVFDVSDLPYAD